MTIQDESPLFFRRYRCTVCEHSSCDIEQFDPVFVNHKPNGEWICRDCAEDCRDDDLDEEPMVCEEESND